MSMARAAGRGGAARSQAARGLLMRFYLETAGGESLAHLDDARSAAHA